MNILIYDTEIRHGVPTADNPIKPGYKYAKDWSDFTGMGIAVVCAFDVLEARSRVFCEDNIGDFMDLIEQRDVVMGFNNWRFDDNLLHDNGFSIPRIKSRDLAAAIWHAAGVPQGEHPRGLSLNACCKALGLPEKTGNGADAPQDWQDGRIGRVIDYCQNDVRITLRLYRSLQGAGGMPDPRNEDNWLNVAVPR